MSPCLIDAEAPSEMASCDILIFGQFRSWRHASIVMLGLPLALLGAVGSDQTDFLVPEGRGKTRTLLLLKTERQRPHILVPDIIQAPDARQEVINLLLPDQLI